MFLIGFLLGLFVLGPIGAITQVGYLKDLENYPFLAPWYLSVAVFSLGAIRPKSRKFLEGIFGASFGFLVCGAAIWVLATFGR